jgi:hypothetical protein
MRIRYFLLLICGLYFPAYAVEDITIIQQSFLPSTFYVGDTVEMRVTFQTPFNKNLTIPVEMPNVEWGKIQRMELLELGSALELRVIFTSWAPGTQTFPAIRVGSLSFEQLTVHVSSIIDREQRAIPRIQSPALLPGTSTLLVVQIIVVLLLIALLIFSGFVIIPRIRRVRRRWHSALPLRRAQRSLRDLAVSAPRQEIRAIYIALLEETRTYFTDRLKIPALAATTSELEAMLEPLIDDPELINQIIELFREGDRVKFANIAGSHQQAVAHIHGLSQVLKQIEEVLHHGGL